MKGLVSNIRRHSVKAVPGAPHKAALVLWVFLAVGVFCASAEQDCATCDQPAFPEAAAFLEAHGYPAQGYTVLLAWQEATRNGGGPVLTGYHVLPADGSNAFDLYSDPKGRLVDASELAVLGVRAKDWLLPPIEQATEVPAAVAKLMAPRPVPVGPSRKASSSACLNLPPVDVTALREEDVRSDTGPAKGAKRMGIVRALPECIMLSSDAATVGSWQGLPDGGWLWSVTVCSPEARAIRVHFASLRVPTGCGLVLYNAVNPIEAYGPYQRPYGSDRDLWSASCFADTVAVECYVPAGTRAAGLNVTIDEIAHTYEDFGLLQWAKVAGPCHNDVACYPEWATVARAVGGFTFIVEPNQLHCTGTLVADTDARTNIPYFLTANHCVSVQSGSTGASSMEFFWLYQAPSCDATPPALADVPRTTGGADFLAGISSGTGSDFALVRLRNEPPADLPRAGWSTASVAVGTEVAAIHHPSNEYKRISFGVLTDTGSPQNGGGPLKPYEFFHEVHWNKGSTESGSSGAPLLSMASQLLIGQLWGGYAACGKPEEPDYFGRFDQTFPVLEPWLDPAPNPFDIDNSGRVDSVDIQLVVNAALGISIPYNGDVDRSGAVDAVDVQLVINAVLKGG